MNDRPEEWEPIDDLPHVDLACQIIRTVKADPDWRWQLGNPADPVVHALVGLERAGILEVITCRAPGQIKTRLLRKGVK